MSRFSFGIFGQNSDELISGLDVKIRDVNDTVIADKSGNLAHTIEDNGDGTYYVDSLPQSLINVYVGDSAQDELQNIFFPTEATADHISDDTKHRAINDVGTGATETFSNSKVNTLLASKSNTSHNHATEYATLGHDHDTDYADISHSGDNSIHREINDSGTSNTALFSANHIIDELDMKANEEAFTVHTGDNSIHREIDDSGVNNTDLFSASKINTELALKADDADLTSHSGDADKHREINDLGSGVTDVWSGNHIITYINNKATFSSDDFAGGLGSDVTIKQDFNDQTILDNSKRLNQNLESLQTAIGGGPIPYEERANHLTANLANKGKLYYYNSGPSMSSGTYGLYFIAQSGTNSYHRLTVVEDSWGGGGGN